MCLVQLLYKKSMGGFVRSNKYTFSKYLHISKGGQSNLERFTASERLLSNTNESLRVDDLVFALSSI